MPDTSNILILGASRGLGLALAQEWCARGARVIATVRTPSDELDALARRFPGSLSIESADLDDAASIRSLRARLDGRRIDILFVNAGIARGNELTPVTIAEGDFLAMMRTNALGPVRALELLEDLVAAGGVLATMSSELASLAHNQGFWPLYSASKAALNMLMKGFAGQRPGDPRAMLIVAPGWIRTEMGGPGATYSIEEAIPQVVDMVERNRGKAGLRFVDRFNRTLPW